MPAQRYVEKPRELDLIQWTGANAEDVLAFLQSKVPFAHQIDVLTSASGKLAVWQSGRTDPHPAMPTGTYVGWESSGPIFISDIGKWEPVPAE